ncbi:MAG: hypothetical protein IPK66_16485 [Rhodospirillales bacterium]|nr:hypothetical protein [Rhodospirillales bacterium]
MIEVVKDLWLFLNERRKLWMWPIVILMLLMGALVVFAKATVIAPFIYTLF